MFYWVKRLREAAGQRLWALALILYMGILDARSRLLSVLELLQGVGTLDDLESLANMSVLFNETRFITTAEIEALVEGAFE